jgi:hypothetical protein
MPKRLIILVFLLVFIFPIPVKADPLFNINSFYRYGIASTYGPGFDYYIALPEGSGIRVEICGYAGCIIRISNDCGPDTSMQKLGRIIDLNLSDFLAVGGKDAYIKGLINVRLRYLTGGE